MQCMKLAFHGRKFNEASEYIYFYIEIINRFKGMRRNPRVKWIVKKFPSFLCHQPEKK